MNLIKLNRNRVELRNNYGILQHVICEGAQNANLSNCGKFVIVTKLNGNVDLRRVDGILVQTITRDAVDAKFQGNELLIYKTNGKCELRRMDGILIQSF